MSKQSTSTTWFSFRERVIKASVVHEQGVHSVMECQECQELSGILEILAKVRKMSGKFSVFRIYQENFKVMSGIFGFV